MKTFAWILLASLWGAAFPAQAQVSNFQHIVVIVQENRTPDNMFQALCATQQCSPSAQTGFYDIQTANWLDKNSQTGTIQPTPVALSNHYDLGHAHSDFVSMCDLNTTTNSCMMDGAAGVVCKPVDAGEPCPSNPQFRYVDNSTQVLSPYLAMITQYGWANLMFQTNQGPSFPAHQFLFGATSAPSRKDDHEGTFASENLRKYKINGCIAFYAARVQLIDANGQEAKDNKIFPCFEHKTLGDLLDKQSASWRYYTPGPGSLWSAPDAIKHICEPENGFCTGALWKKNVDPVPSHVLSDVQACDLRNVSWVIPTGTNSDHAGITGDGGPSWVASIVNAIGTSACRNADNSTYWNSTAIVIVWDDWGGWYDHEPPTFLPYPEGGYQYGFRVPMLFVSAYTPAGFIDNNRRDFGSIARFIEYNFGSKEGALSFADARSTNDLAPFYNLSATPRPYVVIPAPKNAEYFLHDKSPLTPPDDD